MSKVFEIVTQRIIAMLEKGVIPWRRPWKGAPPQNLITRKPYRGINALILGFSGSSFFITFKQAQAIGAHVKKGAQGLPVVFWKFLDSKDSKQQQEDEESTKTRNRRTPMLRYYTVFRIEDVEGIPESKLPEIIKASAIEPIEQAEKIVGSMPQRPEINYGGNSAFYKPSSDSVTVPVKGAFGKIEEFYSTLFHELTHSTGHPSRLARKSLEAYAPFGSADYSREELVAEMGAGFLCASCGIDNSTLENSASYIDHWMKALKADPRAVIVAAGQAQKAADFILGENPAEVLVGQDYAPPIGPGHADKIEIGVQAAQAPFQAIEGGVDGPGLNAGSGLQALGRLAGKGHSGNLVPLFFKQLACFVEHVGLAGSSKALNSNNAVG